MLHLSEEFIEILEAVYFDSLVKIAEDYKVPHGVALCLARDFFDGMLDSSNACVSDYNPDTWIDVDLL